MTGPHNLKPDRVIRTLVRIGKIITITSRMVVKLREGAQRLISPMKKFRISGKEALIEPSSCSSATYFTDFCFE
jgi:hypothetical protein